VADKITQIPPLTIHERLKYAAELILGTYRYIAKNDPENAKFNLWVSNNYLEELEKDLR
jgi:hypothetical protein